VKLIKRLIEIHQKWIIEGLSDAENDAAGLRAQEVARRPSLSAVEGRPTVMSARRDDQR
jgi:hypothetical protein